MISRRLLTAADLDSAPRESKWPTWRSAHLVAFCQEVPAADKAAARCRPAPTPATLPACRCRPHAMEPPEPSPAHALRRLAALSQDDTPLGGAGGAVVDVLLMLLPLVFLVTVTISRRLYMPISHSVPLAAAALYLFK